MVSIFLRRITPVNVMLWFILAAVTLLWSEDKRYYNLHLRFTSNESAERFKHYSFLSDSLGGMPITNLQLQGGTLKAWNSSNQVINSTDNVLDFQIEGNRKALLFDDGSFRVENLETNQYLEEENVKDFQLEGNRIAVLKHESNRDFLKVKKGDFTEPWVDVFKSPLIKSFQLEGERIAVLEKAGSIDIIWATDIIVTGSDLVKIHEASYINAFQLEEERIGILYDSLSLTYVYEAGPQVENPDFDSVLARYKSWNIFLLKEGEDLTNLTETILRRHSWEEYRKVGPSPYPDNSIRSFQLYENKIALLERVYDENDIDDKLYIQESLYPQPDDWLVIKSEYYIKAFQLEGNRIAALCKENISAEDKLWVKEENAQWVEIYSNPLIKSFQLSEDRIAILDNEYLRVKEGPLNEPWFIILHRSFDSFVLTSRPDILILTLENSNIRIETNGATFVLLPFSMHIRQHIPIDRDLGKLNFVLPVHWSLRKDTTGAIFLTGKGITPFRQQLYWLRINGDCLIMLQSLLGEKMSFDVICSSLDSATIAKPKTPNLMLFDTLGPTTPYRVRGGMSFHPIGWRYYEITRFNNDAWHFDLASGQYFYISVFPPKIFDWDKGDERIFTHWGSYSQDSTPAYFSNPRIDSLRNTEICNFWNNDDRRNILLLGGFTGLYEHWNRGYEVREPNILNERIDYAHKHEKKLFVMLYTSPTYFTKSSHFHPNYDDPLYENLYCPVVEDGENSAEYLDAVKDLLDKHHIDGVYFDEIYRRNIPERYRVIKEVKMMLREKWGSKHRIFYHASWGLLNGGIFMNRIKTVFCPSVDAYADFMFRGEQDKNRLYSDSKYSDDYYRRFISCFNMSNSVGHITHSASFIKTAGCTNIPDDEFKNSYCRSNFVKYRVKIQYLKSIKFNSRAVMARKNWRYKGIPTSFRDLTHADYNRYLEMYPRDESQYPVEIPGFDKLPPSGLPDSTHYITLVSPRDGGWFGPPGKTCMIKWQSWLSDPIIPVQKVMIAKLEYSTNGGATFHLIGSTDELISQNCNIVGSNTYPWVIPDIPITNNCLIRVIGIDKFSGEEIGRDVSDVPFSTGPPASGFEETDIPCLEHIRIGGKGVLNADAYRCWEGDDVIEAHSGERMYKLIGIDNNSSPNQNDFVVFNVFPYQIPIIDSTYLSFWIYVKESPGGDGHIVLQGVTKSGVGLGTWERFGRILDQTGQILYPAHHTVPQGEWKHYVFTLNPASGDTINYFNILYDDLDPAESGEIVVYFDDFEILNKFPIPDTWHAEKFPIGVPLHNPNNCDPNFYMNFEIVGDSVNLIIDPQGNPRGVPVEGHWVKPTPGLRNDIGDVLIDYNTVVSWEQYDEAYSLILSLLIKDSSGEDRWLKYAKNAHELWEKVGWVDMDVPTQHFEIWESFYRNIRDDYLDEYEFEPEIVKELRLEHFARSDWDGNRGGMIRNLYIDIDRKPPALAYNFQDKMVMDNNGVIHIVYQDKNIIMYAYSEDGGETFSGEKLLGAGEAPVIFLLLDDNLGVVWTMSTETSKKLFYRKRMENEWSSPVRLYETQEDFSILPANFTVDNNGMAYVTRELEQLEQIKLGSYSWWLHCGSFDPTSSQPVVEKWVGIDSLLGIHPPPPLPPHSSTAASSDLVADNGLIHLLWNRPTGGIFYSKENGIEWTEPFGISPDIDVSFLPSLSKYEGRLGCVWQAGDVPEIYYSYTDNYENWSEPLNISNTETGSYSPIISANAFILWSEEMEDKTDIVLSSYDRVNWTNEYLTETTSHSSFPHSIISDGYPEASLGVLYQEGNSYPYDLQYLHKDVIIPWWTSDREDATATNGQRKMMVDENGLFHLVFESDGHIFYTTSLDGEKWSLEEYLGEGVLPAIAFDADERPNCIWVRKPVSINDPYILMFSRKEAAGWMGAFPLYTSDYYIEAPSFVIREDPGVGAMPADTGFVAFEEGYTFVPDEHNQIIFGKFGITGFGGAEPFEFETEVVDDVIGVRGVKTPSLSISGSTIHLVYERDWEIIYTARQDGSWSDKRRLSELGGTSSEPMIDVYGTGKDLVWNSDGVIYHRRGNLSGIEWANKEVVGGKNAFSPVICAGSQLIWCEKNVDVDPVKYYLYFSRFDGHMWSISPIRLTEDDVSERYPQMLIKEDNGAEVHYVFTRGDKNPYIISSNHFTTDVPNLFNGRISENTTWDKNIYIMGDVTIEPAVTLTVEPGVNVYFPPLTDVERGGIDSTVSEIKVEGALVAKGTISDSIVFTSASLNPSSGDFWGIRFLDSSDDEVNSIEHCRIEYGCVGISCEFSSANIKHNNIRENAFRFGQRPQWPYGKPFFCFLGAGIVCFESEAAIDSNTIFHNGWMDFPLLREMNFDTLDSGLHSVYSSVSVTNNIVEDNNGGISSWGDNGSFYSANQIIDNATGGISISGKATIENNTIRTAVYENTIGLSINLVWEDERTRIDLTSNTIEGHLAGVASFITPIGPGMYPDSLLVYAEDNDVSNNMFGIAVSEGGEDVFYKYTLTDNRITDNDSVGVWVMGWPAYQGQNPVVLGNIEDTDTTNDGGNYIYNNLKYDVMNEHPERLYAQGCFWGTTDSVEIDSHIYDDDENPLCGMVDFGGHAISGELPGDEVWEGNIYICGDILVPENITLTIVEGSTVRFAANFDINNLGVDEGRSELIVEGNLEIKPKSSLLGSKYTSLISPIDPISSISPKDLWRERSNMKGSKVEKLKGSKEMIDGQPVHYPIVFTSDAYEPSPTDWYGIELGGLNFEENGKDGLSKKSLLKREGKDMRNERNIHYFDIEYAKRGLVLCEDENLSMKDCTFRNNEAGLKLTGHSDITVKGCVFENNTTYGIFVGDGVIGNMKDDTVSSNSAGIMFVGDASVEAKELVIEGNETGVFVSEVSKPSIKESRIIGNTEYGVYITDDAEPDLGGGKGHNYIYGSGLYDLYNNTDNRIMAKKNYWGTMDIDTVQTHIYDYYDDNTLGIVEVEPLWNGDKTIGGAMSSGRGETPLIYSLRCPSPNPFENNTSISYSIAKPGNIYLCVYDVTGRLIKTLEKTKKDSGVYIVKWSGFDNNNRKISAGIYFIRLRSGDFTSVKKIILVK